MAFEGITGRITGAAQQAYNAARTAASQQTAQETEVERLMRIYGIDRNQALQLLGISPNGGGGGGGGSSWNPANVTGDTSATLAQRDKEHQWSSQFQESQFQWQKTMDERNAALAAGDLELAKEKQADANRWQQESARLEGQRNQTGQFGAETDRAVGMGDLALRNNEFIAKMANSPRNFSTLFAMQRGLAPDWDTMAAGGKPAQGAALAPSDVMNAYRPTTPPVNGGMGRLPYVPPPNIASGGGQMTDMRYRPPGGDMQRAVMPPQQSQQLPYDQMKKTLQRMADGGYTTAPVIMTGDAPSPDPNAGGARPEVTYNPTRAPLKVEPNPNTMRDMMMMADFGMMPRYAGGTGMMDEMGMMKMMMPRYAIGTDMSGAYEANGMGSSWIPNSDNKHLQGMDLPRRVQMQADIGMPISPALAAATTGGVAPQLNMGAAVSGYGAGSLPSLQALNNMDPNEREAIAGYFEGAGGGFDFASLVDFIGKGTKHLKTAARSRGI